MASRSVRRRSPYSPAVRSASTHRRVGAGRRRSSPHVVDFFAGSGTTADALLQLNNEDGGKRKFILVQLPEKKSSARDILLLPISPASGCGEQLHSSTNLMQVNLTLKINLRLTAAFEHSNLIPATSKYGKLMRHYNRVMNYSGIHLNGETKVTSLTDRSRGHRLMLEWCRRVERKIR